MIVTCCLRLFYSALAVVHFLRTNPKEYYNTLHIPHIHRVTVTQFCSISMLVDFCRHFVGKTLRNVYHCDSA